MWVQILPLAPFKVPKMPLRVIVWFMVAVFVITTASLLLHLLSIWSLNPAHIPGLVMIMIFDGIILVPILMILDDY